MAWAKNGSVSEVDPIDLSITTPTKFNILMNHNIASGVTDINYRVGNGSVDTGTNYSTRYSSNGASDLTSTSADRIIIDAGDVNPDSFVISYFINISSEEKLFISFQTDQGAVGAASAPDRLEIAAKWANTSNQIDAIQVYERSPGTLTSDSNLSAIGTD